MGYKIPNQFELNQIALRKKKISLQTWFYLELDEGRQQRVPSMQIISRLTIINFLFLWETYIS